MAVRFHPRHTWGLIVLPLFLGLGAAAYASARNHDVASEPPAAADLYRRWSGQERAILWFVRPKDLLSCNTAGRILRHVMAEERTRANLTVIGVGADSTWTASLLNTERLRGQVRIVSEREYARMLGDHPTPAIQILRGGRATRAVYAPRTANDDSLRAQVEVALYPPPARVLKTPE